MPYDPRDRAVSGEQLPSVRPWVMETWPARMLSDAITKARELGEIGTTSGAFLPSDNPELTDEIVARTTGSTGPLFGGGLARAAVTAPTKDVELGIFAGPRAVNAPKDALYDAFAMKQGGAPVEDIWKSTGWAELPDKKWMWEISDDLFKLHPNPDKTNRFMGPRTVDLPSAAEHGPLFESYPDIAEVLLKRDSKPGTGLSQAPRAGSKGIISIGPDQTNDFGWTHIDVGTDMNNPQSVLLHELQHQVQAREGWTPGSNLGWTQKQMMEALNKEIREGRGAQVQPLAQYLNDPSLIYKLYSRNLGEMMARATQYRQDLSPLERRYRHPFMDFDRGIENAIIPR